MAKTKPKCCPPRPFIFIEILLGGGETSGDGRELLDSGDYELLDSGDYELLDNA